MLVLPFRAEFYTEMSPCKLRGYSHISNRYNKRIIRNSKLINKELTNEHYVKLLRRGSDYGYKARNSLFHTFKLDIGVGTVSN